MNRFIPSLPARDYLADQLGEDVPLLSSSMAQTMLEESPWHAHQKHPKLGAVDVTTTRPQKLGTALHAALLRHHESVEIIDAKDFRTKLAQELRDNAVAAGKTPVLKDAWKETCDIADHVFNELQKHGIDLDKMQHELTATWEEQTDKGYAVACKGRFDAFDGRTIWDLKTCSDVAPLAIERSIVDYGYHVQGAAYVSAADTINPRMAGRHQFGLIFVENKTNAVRIVRLDGTFQEMGRVRWRAAVEAWRQCLSANRWPLAKDSTPYVAQCPEWHRIQTDRQVLELKEMTWTPEVVG